MSRELGIHLGRRIRDLRQQAGLTQAELASASLKSIETISNFERGKTIPSVLTLANLAEHLNVKVQAFMEFDQPVRKKAIDPVLNSIAVKVKQLSPRDRKLVADFIKLLKSHRSR